MVLDWNNIAVTTVRAGVKFQAEGEIYMSYTQAAVYDAVVSISGGYEQYRTDLVAPEGALPEAAAAAAAHRVLVSYFPAQSSSLDTKYAASLAGMPPGTPRDAGVLVGERAATAILNLRAADVLSGSGGYTFPTPGPGVWSLPTPDGTATAPQTPWIRQLTPFMLESASQFRPEAPDAITSEEFAANLAEVQALGGASSTARTADETIVARFWSANIINQYNITLRSVAVQHGMDIGAAARLLAMGNMAVGDASIACWDAKYAYSFWRPVQAIRSSSDPTWTPLLAPTPNHPEYPSAHGCVTSAFARAISVALATRHISVDVPGINPATGLLDPAYTRHFDTVAAMTHEIENARVWGGLHYRNSVEVGIELGRNVARYDLQRNFRSVNDSDVQVDE
ncbi:MAG TPA: vanadium-dependent haloperoxidase [Candidatus Dormibacteraeota bacterium]